MRRTDKPGTSFAERIKALQAESYALFLAMRHPGTPPIAKVVAGAVLAYLFSPIDLIPDFIPVIGHLDDLILIPLGIALAVRLVPKPIMAECRLKAQGVLVQKRNWKAGVVVIVVWVLCAAVLMWWGFHWMRKPASSG
jgi:uncharacterized membrane protein YkvA (DUF1232 family)